MEPIMHFFNVATIFTVLCLIGVEFSVAAFVDPAAWRLDPEPQLTMLRRFAFVPGKVMPVWYPLCALLLAIQTWLHCKTFARGVLLTSDAIWLLGSVGSIVFLVPLNTRIAEGDAHWQQIHRIWDKRHRVRTAALAVAAILLTYALVR